MKSICESKCLLFTTVSSKTAFQIKFQSRFNEVFKKIAFKLKLRNIFVNTDVFSSVDSFLHFKHDNLFDVYTMCYKNESCKEYFISTFEVISIVHNILYKICV